MKQLFLSAIHSSYRIIAKPIFFLQDPEKVHTRITHIGQRLGASPAIRGILSGLFRSHDPILSQSLFQISFESPIGLAAGFDYEARLTQILPCLGFGFGTVGTITNAPYEGNPRPMLGRLPKSRSLMVNKGFKNLGMAATLKSLKGTTFAYHAGISIGKTNTAELKTQKSAVEDIISAFKMAEASDVPFSYYELNISCPNLQGSIEFYEPAHLEELLAAVGALSLAKPVWIKMPLTKTDEEAKKMLDVIVRHSFVKAVIFGNLQRDRTTPTLDQDEVKQFPKGNFSGVPCRERSDELIRLAFQNYGSRIAIIGCGGVFSAEDAYRKIRLGASLVELITGLIFEGPQLVSEINLQLGEFLRRDGYRSIAEAVGRGI
jgi:dihydroorotate dehydrogenase subfamily 2